MNRYYVYGMGYDKNGIITDYECEFGDFDTLEDAHKLFTELINSDRTAFFEKAPNIYQLCVQIEECEENEDVIECVDILNEWWFINPGFREE